MEWTGIILAGGHSSRMGTNKAVLPLGGLSVIERIVGELQKAAGHIVISSGQSSAYAGLGLPLLPDIYPGCGPLAGIHAGLAASPHRWSLVVSCDMPFVNAPLFRFLAEQVRQHEEQGSDPCGEILDALVPRIGGRPQPLLAMYNRSVLCGLERTLGEGRLKANQWVSGLKARYIGEQVLSEASGLSAELAAFNMNRPEDYQAAQRLYEQQNLQ